MQDEKWKKYGHKGLNINIYNEKRFLNEESLIIYMYINHPTKGFIFKTYNRAEEQEKNYEKSTYGYKVFESKDLLIV